jgi:hypothetical protein
MKRSLHEEAYLGLANTSSTYAKGTNVTHMQNLDTKKTGRGSLLFRRVIIRRSSLAIQAELLRASYASLFITTALYS